MPFSVPPFDASSTQIAVPIPSAFTYNLEGASFSLIDNSTGPAIAVCSKTAKQIFAGTSTVQTSPAATYYVAATGSDSNNGTSSGTPFATLSKAITTANTGGVATKIYMASGTYYRASLPGSTPVYPAVDLAIVATGGRVTLGTFDSFTSPGKDATYTNTYSWTRSNVDRVMDIVNHDKYGHYNELLYVTTPAICNITPGSWTQSGSTLYVNRADGAAVTASNTRYYLTTVSPLILNAGVSLYLGNEDGYSGFDFEGGFLGCLVYSFSSAPTTKKIVVAENCTFRYAGGLLSTSARGISAESLNGRSWFFNCDASHNITDGFNNHNGLSAANNGMVTVNCTAFNNGAGPNVGQQSNNGWTSHENCMSADFGGRYEDNHGGTCRSINTSISLLAGTYVKNDQGDRMFTGGTLPPTAFQTDNTASYYCFRTKAEMAGGQFAYNANGAGANIYLRQTWPTRGITSGVGTIGTW